MFRCPRGFKLLSFFLSLVTGVQGNEHQRRTYISTLVQLWPMGARISDRALLAHSRVAPFASSSASVARDACEWPLENFW